MYFKVEPYAPRMQKGANGGFKYVKVKPYNGKWLKYQKEGIMSGEQREGFDPASAWLEDRWTLVRRMAGDELTQNFFYKVCAFTWRTNDIALGDDIKIYQDAVIE